MRKTALMVMVSLLVSAALVRAQGVGDWGENTHHWNPPKPQGWSSPDSLFIGATFLRDTTKDFIVRFHFQEAGCTGELYLMVPGGRSGGGDTMIFLFSNRTARGTSVNLTNVPTVRTNIHNMDTIFFMYKVVRDICCGCDTFPRYTGPNRAPGEGWTNTDRYYANNHSTATFTSPDGNVYQIGRRWAVAGWIRNPALNARTDTVEFGFEDLTPGDADYDDNLFHVSGVFLIRPSSIVNMTLDAQPANDTILAGENVSYTANVYIDSVDNNGQHYVFLDPVRSAQVTWMILGDATGGSLSTAGPSRSSVFTATRAYRTYTIQATIRDPATGQIMQRTMTVYVKPAGAYRLTIENAYNTAGGLDLNRANVVNSITMSGTTVRDSLYAIIRDRYENFVSACGTSAWAVIVRPDIVSVAVARAVNGEGVISKLGPVGTARVQARDGARPTDPLFRDTVDVVVTAVNYTAVRIVNGVGGIKTVLNGQTIIINLTRDTLLYAEVRREDGVGGDLNDGWVRTPVQWLMSAPLQSANPPPGSDTVWRFAPVGDTGTGTIRARFGGLADAVVNVRVQAGGPDRLTLYSATGAPVPANRYLGPNPPESFTYVWSAGNSYPLTANIFDPYNIWLSGYQSDPLQQYITWVIRDSLFNIDNASGAYNRTTGASVTFTPTRAYRVVHLIATYSLGAVTRRDTVRVRIRPGPADHLVIEPTPDSSVSLNADNPIDQIVMQNNATSVSVYGMLRDRYGNFVKHADSASWSSRRPAVATATMGTNWRLGEGLVTRVTSSNDTTQVLAQYLGLVDSVMVIVSAVTYDSLQIYVLAGGIQYITNLTIRTDQDTTLRARGKRSDNGVWEDVAVNWTSPGVTLNPDAANNQTTFRFRPVSVGSGRVIAERAGTIGTIRDTVLVTVQPGLPTTLAIYPGAGSGDTTRPSPDQSVVDTIRAGTAYNLVAKLFDINAARLTAYASAPANQYLTWRIVELPGNNLPPTGTLSASVGHAVTFTPTRAYNTVDIRVDYNEPGRTVLFDIVRFYIRPDVASRLVIEPAPVPSGIKLNEADKLRTVTLGSTDTIRYAFAVLRDRFGNYVSPSTSTNWQSRETDTVEAREGNAPNGEGLLIRIARSGSSWVVANNRANTALIDSITVVLSNISYTALRIVVGDSTRIESLVMRIDSSAQLYVQGQRSDNGRWENVPANWVITNALSVTPSPPQASDAWNFSPNDTGSGLVIVSMGTAVPDTISVSFTVGLAATLVLYPDTGAPGGNNAPYPDAGETIIDTAGRSLPVVAKLFDYRGNWLRSYERTTSPVSWRVVELSGNPPTGTLAPTDGYRTMFTPTRAYNTVYVVATFTEAGRTYVDTIRVYVVPGRATQLVIEADQNWQASPNAANPVDTVQITSRETYRSVYAILRDSLGNYVSYSTQTQWSSADTALVSAAEGTATIGEGTINRAGTSGLTLVSARSRTDTTLSDNVVVRVIAYYYTDLRIVDANGNPLPRDSLYLFTDSSVTIRVQGLRSDDTTGTHWEYVDARWEMSGGLVTSPPPPERASTWTFSPDLPGAGWIRVTLNNDTVSKPDTLWTVFRRSPPSRVELEIVTPPEQRIAGDTIVAVVRIYNADGLVPGAYCDPLGVHQDILGASSSGSVPVVRVDDSTYNLNQRPDQNVFSAQCFANGVDTVKYVLTYAPNDPDSLHQLYVKINNVWGSSAPFTLHPAALELLVIENANGTSVGEQIEMPYGSSRVFFARGYDRFGNLRGDERSDWSVSGTLHPISRSQNTARVFYEATEVAQGEEGWMRAVAVDTSNGLRTDSVYIVIQGPPIRYLGATTQDVNGNGYLDGVVIRFDRFVTLPSDPMDLAEMFEMVSVVDGRQVFFVVDSIWTGNGTLSDTVLHVRFREDSTTVPGVPQTAWTPYVFYDPTFLGGGFANFPTDAGHPAAIDLVSDGAGPVVWKVTKYVEEGKGDVVEVIFSESIRDSSGGFLSSTTPPSAILNVWRWDGQSGTFVLDTVMLAGLSELIMVSGDTVKFVMTNGADLIPGYYFNVKVPSIVTDATDLRSSPPEDNRKAPLTIKGEYDLKLQSFPNPGRVDTRYAGAMEFSGGYASGARQHVLSGGGGTVTSFTIVVPDSGADGRLGRVQVRRQIYDLAGNVVHAVTEKDLLRTVVDALGAVTSSRIVIDLYWNGFNAKGMPVAPGIYREVVYVYYVDSKKEDRAYINLGIRR